MCDYCYKAVPLVRGKDDKPGDSDYGIAIQRPNILIAYGYDIHGMGSNGTSVRINYCPICGRKLR